MHYLRDLAESISSPYSSIISGTWLSLSSRMAAMAESTFSVRVYA